jgi:hypothetical protein
MVCNRFQRSAFVFPTEAKLSSATDRGQYREAAGTATAAITRFPKAPSPWIAKIAVTFENRG